MVVGIERQMRLLAPALELPHRRGKLLLLVFPYLRLGGAAAASWLPYEGGANRLSVREVCIVRRASMPPRRFVREEGGRRWLRIAPPLRAGRAYGHPFSSFPNEDESSQGCPVAAVT